MLLWSVSQRRRKQGGVSTQCDSRGNSTGPGAKSGVYDSLLEFFDDFQQHSRAGYCVRTRAFVQYERACFCTVCTQSLTRSVCLLVTNAANTAEPIKMPLGADRAFIPLQRWRISPAFSPPLPSSFHSRPLSLFLPLEVGPLNPATGYGGAL